MMEIGSYMMALKEEKAQEYSITKVQRQKVKEMKFMKVNGRMTSPMVMELINIHQVLFTKESGKMDFTTVRGHMNFPTVAFMLENGKDKECTAKVCTLTPKARSGKEFSLMESSNQDNKDSYALIELSNKKKMLFWLIH
jgi:hypothetical protein